MLKQLEKKDDLQVSMGHLSKVSSALCIHLSMFLSMVCQGDIEDINDSLCGFSYVVYSDRLLILLFLMQFVTQELAKFALRVSFGLQFVQFLVHVTAFAEILLFHALRCKVDIVKLHYLHVQSRISKRLQILTINCAIFFRKVVVTTLASFL